MVLIMPQIQEIHQLILTGKIQEAAKRLRTQAQEEIGTLGQISPTTLILIDHCIIQDTMQVIKQTNDR